MQLAHASRYLIELEKNIYKKLDILFSAQGAILK